MNDFKVWVCSSIYHKDVASSRGILILASSSSSPRHCSHQKSAQNTVVSFEKQGGESCPGLEVWTCKKYNKEKIPRDENSQERFVDWTNIHVEWDYLYVLEPTLKKSRSFWNPHLFALRKFKSPWKCVVIFCYLGNTVHDHYPLGSRSDGPLLMKLVRCRTMAFLLGFRFDFL